MKSLKQIIDMNAQYLEGFEPEEHKDDTMDCIGEFRRIWASAAPPEKKLIKELVEADDLDSPGRVQYERVKQLYNRLLPMLRPAKVDTPQRRSHVRARWKDMSTLDEWESYFRLVARCPHLIGKGEEWNGRLWQADFDWLIKPSNFAKVVEGKYGE